ncbi:MAG: cupin domain-containing protein [Chloroflexota bacterium]|nr:cupin domain-containing protein [Chloroflexota bacterium]
MTSDNHKRPNSTYVQWRNQLAKMLRHASADSETSEINIGKRLQELRFSKGLSLRALAEMSGLNVNTLSLIENEKTSPNVSTLQQIANALNVPITSFFQPLTAKKDTVFQKEGKRTQINFPQGIFEDLGGGLTLGEGTPLLMTLEPNHESDPDPIIHTGQEFVYCLEGSLVFWVGNREFVLEPGDSLIFEAHIPHRWENRGDCISRSILIICPTGFSDRSVTQHFVDRMSNI